MNIEHPVTSIEVSAKHEHYKAIRDYADSLVGNSYWSVCDQLVEDGYECEFDILEDNSDKEFSVNYVKFNSEDRQDRLGTITLVVSVKKDG